MRILIFNIGIADSEIFRRLRLTLSERNPHGFDKPETHAPFPRTAWRTQIPSNHITRIFHLWSKPLSERRDYKSLLRHNRFWGLTLYIYFCVWEYLQACSEGLPEGLWNMLLLIMLVVCHTFHFFKARFFTVKMSVHQRILFEHSHILKYNSGECCHTLWGKIHRLPFLLKLH